jgi:hypothetical protein
MEKDVLVFVDNTGHVGLELAVTRDVFCIAGSGPAERGIFPMSTASSWTVVMFEGRGYIVLACTNNGLFRPTCEEV